MTETDIICSIEGHVATIELNRPQVRNAFTMEMIHRWADFLQEVAVDDNVRVVVLTGRGSSFCSGIDLAVLDAVEPTLLARKEMLTRNIHRVAYAMEALDKPVIAAMNGPATGAGLDMALMCDLRIAAQSATFAESYIRIGLVPGDGGCFFLPKLIGPARAMEMLLTGRTVAADEALSMGLVNEVVADDELMTSSLALAGRIANGSPIAIQMIKRATKATTFGDLGTHLDLVSSHLATVMLSDDYLEARNAAKEKRVPVFTRH